MKGLRIASLYLPNGNPAPGPKFSYKLKWFARLRAHAKKLLASMSPVVIAGDYNVMPTDLDVYGAPFPYRTANLGFERTGRYGCGDDSGRA